MVKLAFILLLLVSSSAFAYPPSKSDLQQKIVSVAPVTPAVPTLPVTQIQETGTSQPSSETTDVTHVPSNPFETLDGPIHTLIPQLHPRERLILANSNRDFRSKLLKPQARKELVATNQELSILEQFRFNSKDARMAQLLESYLVDKYIADPAKIRLAVRKLDVESDQLIWNLSKLLPNTGIYQVLRDIATVRGRLMVEVMNICQDRGNDDDMDRLLMIGFKRSLLETAELQFNRKHSRMTRLLEFYLIDKYGADPAKIRAAVRNLDIESNQSIWDLAKLLPNRGLYQVLRGIGTVRGRFMVHNDDDEMDLLLTKGFKESPTAEEQHADDGSSRRVPPPDQKTIHALRAYCLLEDGDNRLIAYMKDNFNMQPVTTQAIINVSRERMLREAKDGIAHKLFYYNDDKAMDERIEILATTKEESDEEKSAEEKIENAKAIKDAISKARKKIQSEKENLDATDFAAYNDDQKMIEFLGNYLENPTFDIKKIVLEARWELSFDHALMFRKPRASRQLLRARTSYHRHAGNFPGRYPWTP